MKRLPSDSSFDGDDSTVSSKSNRHQDRMMNGGSSVSSRGQEQQVADFSDMPSLATYRADEISLASTLRTDGDQSLPSLSSCRTKDLSVAGSQHSKTRMMAYSGVSESEEEDESESEDIGITENKAGILSVTSSKPDELPPGTLGGVQQTAEASSQLDAAGARGGDCLPRLPRRIAMEDSRQRSQQSRVSEIEDSESESASYVSDDSPDVSIDTDEEHDDSIEPTREPIHMSPGVPAAEQLSPQSQKSAVEVNGNDSPKPLGTEDAKEKVKSKKSQTKSKSKKGSSRSRDRIDPPAEIATPPSGPQSTRKRSPKTKVDQVDAKESPAVPSPNSEEGQRFRVRRKKDSETGKSKKHGEKGRPSPRRSTSESGTRLRDPKKKNSDKGVRGVRRANSEMAALFLNSKKPEEDKKRGILKRFSSSLMHMVRPVRATKSGTFGNFGSPKSSLGGKKRSKLKRMSKKDNKGKTVDEAAT